MMTKIKRLKRIFIDVYHLVPQLIYASFIKVVLQLIDTLIIIYLPVLFVDLITKNYDFQAKIWMSATILTIHLFIHLLTNFLDRIISINRDYGNDLMIQSINEELLDAPYELLEQPSFIDLKEGAISAFDQYYLVSMIFEMIPKTLQSILSIISLSILILIKSPLIFITILLLSAFTLTINHLISKKETKLKHQLITQRKNLNYYQQLINNLEFSKDIRVYKLQDYLSYHLNTIIKTSTYTINKLTHLKESRSIIIKSAALLLRITFYLSIILSTLGQNINLSEVILIFNSSIILNNNILSLIDDLLVLNQQLILLQHYENYKETVVKEKPHGTLLLSKKIQKIEFRDVTFSYPNQGFSIINHLNLTINHKESLAIVGLNGAGKTTLVKLLLGFYRPTSGNILVNDIPLDQFDYNSYLNQLSIVFQDFTIFKTSIKDNICFNKENENLFDDVIKKVKLEKDNLNYDQMFTKTLDSMGIDLSLGQQQKTALARALFKQASTIIFDEPTAALDPLTEMEIFKEMHQATSDNLTIFISHRLSSCRFSKRIILLSEGQIIEEGNHNDLIKLKGKYAELFNQQAQYYNKNI